MIIVNDFNLPNSWLSRKVERGKSACGSSISIRGLNCLVKYYHWFIHSLCLRLFCVRGCCCCCLLFIVAFIITIILLFIMIVKFQCHIHLLTVISFIFSYTALVYCKFVIHFISKYHRRVANKKINVITWITLCF